ncbi:hypothetical protein BGW39_007060 [Mortierella sp. 14UC]|nr:hypothetical protein BGW39_007060 [Mortierella sp. 14UC]
MAFDEGECIKPADFGQSESYQTSEEEPTLDRLLDEYAAPELWNTGCGDFAVDIWALSVCFYELFVGDKPELNDKSNLVPGRRFAKLSPYWQTLIRTFTSSPTWALHGGTPDDEPQQQESQELALDNHMAGYVQEDRAEQEAAAEGEAVREVSNSEAGEGSQSTTQRHQRNATDEEEGDEQGQGPALSKRENNVSFIMA